MTALNSNRKPKATRAQHLAAIHIAEKALGLSKEDYAALKRSITGGDVSGVESSAHMNSIQRSQYLAQLAVLQAKAAEAKGEKPAYQPKRPMVVRNIDDADDKQWSRARALWHALSAAGEVHSNTDAALQKYATRQTHVTAWRFQTQAQITLVIESLKKWCLRCGVPVNKQSGDE